MHLSWREGNRQIKKKKKEEREEKLREEGRKAEIFVCSHFR